MYSIKTTKSFDKKLRKLPLNWQKRIVEKIKKIAQEPHAANNNLDSMRGQENVYRLRIGDWRVVYELDDDVLIMLVLSINPRGGAYK